MDFTFRIITSGGNEYLKIDILNNKEKWLN